MRRSEDDPLAGESSTEEDDEDGLSRTMSDMGKTFEAGAWPPEMNMPEPTINVLCYFDRLPRKEALVEAVERHLWPCHRFNSCMSDGKWVRTRESMDNSYHFRDVELPGEAAIDSWVQHAMLETLSHDYPPWRVTYLQTPPGGRAGLFIQVHHAVGDGLALLFAFAPMLGCEGGEPIAKIPLPAALLPPELRRSEPPPGEPRDGAAGGGGGAGPPRGGCCSTPFSFMRGLLAPALTQHDTELAINPPLQMRTPFVKFNGNRAFTRFPPISMDIIKSIKTAHSCSVNDVLMAALTGALRRYGAEVRGDRLLQREGETIEFKSLIMLALPRKMDVSDPAGCLANNMLFMTCPLPIHEHTAAGRLDATIAAFNNLKSRPYIAGVAGMTNFAKGIAPRGILRKMASETFSKHSLLVTNVPNTTVPLTVPKAGGEVLREIHMVFPNVVPQVSIITYSGHVCANIVADPALFPQPEALGRLWQQEFDALSELGD